MLAPTRAIHPERFQTVVPWHSMSDNDSGAKRVGDATRARIDDLKGGWKLPSSEDLPSIEDEVPNTEPEAEAPPSAMRPVSEPPAPSPVEAKAEKKPPSGRTKHKTEPPPPPPGRTKRKTEPPPPPQPRKKAPTLPPAPPAGRAPELAPIAEMTPPPRMDTTDAPAAEWVESSEPLRSDSLPAILPRQTGVIGDMRYAVRAIRTQSQSKKKIASLRQQLEDEQEARSRKLLEVAEDAVGDQDNDLSIIGRARDSLSGMEEKRSQHSEQSAKAKDAAAALESSNQVERQEQDAKLARLRSERLEVAESLEPLAKQQSRLRKEIAKARHLTEQLEAKVRSHKAALEGLVGQETRAPVEARLASARAEFEASGGELPRLVDELSALEPQISGLEAQRVSVASEIAKLEDASKDAADRLSEKLAAEQARKVVEDRAAVEEADKKQGALLELGEALRERSSDVSDPRLSEAKRHEREMRSIQQQETKIQELLDSIELVPVLRGSLWIILLCVAIGAAAFVALVY